MSTNIDYMFKLLILGDSGVGKSCILQKFVDDAFSESHLATIGIDYKIKVVNFRNKNIKLKIWDTAGQERFQTITRTYFNGALGIILAYDSTRQESFDNIQRWSKQI